MKTKKTGNGKVDGRSRAAREAKKRAAMLAAAGLPAPAPVTNGKREALSLILVALAGLVADGTVDERTAVAIVAKLGGVQ